MNLHSIVRGAIQAVNPDIQVNYLKSQPYAMSPTDPGRQLPLYAGALTLFAQIQPPSGRDLKHIEFLNLQGTTRVAYLYGDKEGIVRVDSRGGDLIQFPYFNSAKSYLLDSDGNPVTDSNGNFIWSVPPANTWLVTQPQETWDVSGGGWSRVFITLQAGNAVKTFVTDSNGNLVLDSLGNPVWGTA